MSKPKILLVEGDCRSSRLLEAFLGQAGFVPTAVRTADEALARLGLEIPDIIVSEVALEPIDGLELCRTVKGDERYGDIPLVFLTSPSSEESRRAALEVGCDAYVTKPAFVKEFLARLRGILRRTEATTGRSRRSSVVGSFVDLELLHLLQVFELKQKTGYIALLNELMPETSREGALHFRDGSLVDAELGQLRGKAALFRAVAWESGQFEVHFEPNDRERRFQLSTQRILIEATGFIDAWQHLTAQLPALTTQLAVVAGLDEHGLLIPAEAHAILNTVDGRRSIMEILDRAQMPDLQVLGILGKLYFGGALVDSAAPEGALPHLDVVKLPPGLEVKPGVLAPPSASVEGIAAELEALFADDLTDLAEVDESPHGALAAPLDDDSANDDASAAALSDGIEEAEAGVGESGLGTVPQGSVSALRSWGAETSDDGSAPSVDTAELDDERLSDTASLRTFGRARRVWQRAGAALAVTCIVACAAVLVFHGNPPKGSRAASSSTASSPPKQLTPHLPQPPAPSVKPANPRRRPPVATAKLQPAAATAAANRGNAGPAATRSATDRSAAAGPRAHSNIERLAEQIEQQAAHLFRPAGVDPQSSRTMRGYRQQLQQALKRRPNDWRALEGLAVLELARRDADRALEYAQETIQMHPDAPQAHFVLGYVFQSRRLYRAARASYLRYLRLCPKCRFVADVQGVLTTMP